MNQEDYCDPSKQKVDIEKLLEAHYCSTQPVEIFQKALEARISQRVIKKLEEDSLLEKSAKELKELSKDFDCSTLYPTRLMEFYNQDNKSSYEEERRVDKMKDKSITEVKEEIEKSRKEARNLTTVAYPEEYIGSIVQHSSICAQNEAMIAFLLGYDISDIHHYLIDLSKKKKCNFMSKKIITPLLKENGYVKIPISRKLSLHHIAKAFSNSKCVVLDHDKLLIVIDKGVVYTTKVCWFYSLASLSPENNRIETNLTSYYIKDIYIYHEELLKRLGL